ncbi:MAG: arsenate reductase family protein [Ruminococcus sp.]|nr:arsenate reductase family protein [Ruminococcus sp.]
MAIQIFGTKKCPATKKAERFFKERGIRYQFIDLTAKGLSRGEFDSVKQSAGGTDAMINESAKDKQTLTLMKYLIESDREEKLFENQQLLRTPIVRSGKRAAIGEQPELWKEFAAESK